MKILVFNGSPRCANGNTQILVNAFIAGAEEAGAQAEIIYLKDKKINHCMGCFSCWTKTPGVCIQKDDMPELLLKYRKADIIVYASPLYVYTVTGIMKDFMDRVLPLIQPFFTIEGDRCSHPMRYSDTKTKTNVLISNCGFPEQSHFSGLKETFRCMFRGEDRTIAGMICCAGGELLNTPGLKEGHGWYMDAMKKAGQEVVTNGHIDAETQSTLDQPLMADSKLFANMANAHWYNMGLEWIGEEAPQATIPAHSATRLSPPAALETMRDLVAGLPYAFNPTAAKDMKAVIQFDVSNEEPGKYFLEIADGQCAAYLGENPSPTMTITTPAEVWLGIARGEVHGAVAFMTGKYKVSGDLGLMMQFEKLFPKPGH